MKLLGSSDDEVEDDLRTDKPPLNKTRKTSLGDTRFLVDPYYRVDIKLKR